MNRFRCPSHSDGSPFQIDHEEFFQTKKESALSNTPKGACRYSSLADLSFSMGNFHLMARERPIAKKERAGHAEDSSKKRV